MELDKALVDKITPVFKEMNLTQEQGQKLVDFWNEQVKALSSKPYEDYQATRAEWAKEVKDHFGTKFGEAKATIGRAINMLPPEIAKGFRETMDSTGAGDNPWFAKAMHFWAEKLSEGKPVNGGRPTDVTDPARTRMPSAAQALFPNLPSATAQ